MSTLSMPPPTEDTQTFSSLSSRMIRFSLSFFSKHSLVVVKDEPMGENDYPVQFCGSFKALFHISKRPCLVDPYRLKVTLLPNSKSYLSYLPSKKKVSKDHKLPTLFVIHDVDWEALQIRATFEWDSIEESWADGFKTIGY
jgi:hypothetical protein